MGQYTEMTLYIIGSLLVLITLSIFKNLRNSILSIFGGTIELAELAGVIFLMLFIYMIIKEGNRTHEWHYYNELYVFFTAGAAMTGLGLKDVLAFYKDIRLGNKPKEDEPEQIT